MHIYLSRVRAAEVPRSDWHSAARLKSSDVVVRERTVEASGRFGEFVDRQFERTSGGRDHLRRDVATAAGAAHVVEGLADCVHVKAFDSEIPIAIFHGIGMSDYTRAPEGCG